MQVNYDDPVSLEYALQAVNLVISTVKGQSQLALIRAARTALVSRFVPSKFEGALNHRNGASYYRDSYSKQAIALLQEISLSQSQMRYTIFSCGLFYEWFGPGGLTRAQISTDEIFQNFQGALFVDGDTMQIHITEHNAQSQPVRITMTSVADVGQYVAAALSLGIANWEQEYKIRGSQMTVHDLVATFSRVRNSKLFSLFCYKLY